LQMAWFYWFPVPQVSRGAHSRGAHARAIMWERQEGQASKGYWCARGPQNRAGHHPTLHTHRLQLLCNSRIGADQARSQKKYGEGAHGHGLKGEETTCSPKKTGAHDPDEQRLPPPARMGHCTVWNAGCARVACATASTSRHSFSLRRRDHQILSRSALDGAVVVHLCRATISIV